MNGVKHWIVEKTGNGPEVGSYETWLPGKENEAWR